MADPQTSTFEKMGEDPVGSIFNDRTGSAASSPYTIAEPRKNTQAGDIPGTGTKANRGASLIHEANGPACFIAAKIVYPNAEGSDQTQRNVRVMKGGSQFYDARANAENTSGV